MINEKPPVNNYCGVTAFIFKDQMEQISAIMNWRTIQMTFYLLRVNSPFTAVGYAATRQAMRRDELIYTILDGCLQADQENSQASICKHRLQGLCQVAKLFFPCLERPSGKGRHRTIQGISAPKSITSWLRSFKQSCPNPTL